MKVQTMRRVDAWLGVPLCAVLTLWRRLRGLFVLEDHRVGEQGGGRARRGILFVKLAEQGSTVLAHAALQRAVAEYGRENVWFLVFAQNRPILDAMHVIPEANVVAIRTAGLLGTLRATLAAVWKLRRLRLHAAVDLEFFARSSAILTYLSGARLRSGLHASAGDGPWRGDLFTHRVLYNPHLHTAQVFDLQVRALREPAERFPALDLVPTPIAELARGRLEAGEGELAEVRGIIATAFGGDRPQALVLLNANCSDLLPLRKWSEERYVELARRLLAREPGLGIAFTGAPDEAPHVGRLVEAIASPRCASLAGKTTMRQLLVLYECADVLVTNDSGPAHFGTLTPVDVVVLFGPETPELFGGLSPATTIVWARTACSPCVNAYNNRVSTCHDNVCMQRIEVGEVEGRVVGALARRRSGKGVERPYVLPAREPAPAPVGGADPTPVPGGNPREAAPSLEEGPGQG
ncbi:MAG: glycosyltransferase family 9 protein [Planctomycetota bacterium]